MSREELPNKASYLKDSQYKVKSARPPKVTSGALPKSDKRTDSLKAKYSKEAGIFKLYANKVARMKESGTPGDQIGTLLEGVETVTSPRQGLWINVETPLRHSY
jgi:hypothetical protein